MQLKSHLAKSHLVQHIPQAIGTIHLIGIGGIGISGIAEMLHHLGYQVSGSDLSDNANVKRLREKGITIHIGHAPENVKDAAMVVKSTAVKEDNPEIIAARAAGIPIVKRADMLSALTRHMTAIAVAGAHGKTTTTSLVGHLLEEAGLDPTIINGGIINAHGSNVLIGDSDWAVIEADESDGTFLTLSPTFCIVTNIDPEHLDYWHDFDALKKAFIAFVHQLPFFGAAVVCADDAHIQSILPLISDRRMVTYGIANEAADIVASNLGFDGTHMTFDVAISERVMGHRTEIKQCKVGLIGEHNVLNALAVIGIGYALKLPVDVTLRALAKSQGVKRRFTITGEVGGVMIVDDYGHHPNEITATLRAARLVASSRKGKVIAVIQPHRFTRVRDLFEEFTHCARDADHVIVAEIYTAGEKPIPGITSQVLCDKMNARGTACELLQEPEALLARIKALTQSGDVVVCLGAGSITQWAQSLPESLQQGAAKKIASHA